MGGRVILRQSVMKFKKTMINLPQKLQCERNVSTTFVTIVEAFQTVPLEMENLYITGFLPLPSIYSNSPVSI